MLKLTSDALTWCDQHVGRIVWEPTTTATWRDDVRHCLETGMTQTLAEMEEELCELQNDLDECRMDLSAKEDAYAELEDENGELKRRIKDLEDEIAELNEAWYPSYLGSGI